MSCPIITYYSFGDYNKWDSFFWRHESPNLKITADIRSDNKTEPLKAFRYS